MKRTRFLQTLLLLITCFFALSSCNKKPENLRILIITGGHDFNEEGFFRMIDNFEGIEYDRAEHPYAHALLKKEKISNYAAVLLYDMPQEISKETQGDFISMLNAGKGLVILHHAFCSYESWTEYTQIAGGRYHHYSWEKEGAIQPPSDYKHDVTFNIKVEDPSHPIVRGISDFVITDENYSGIEILPDIHPLLSTEEPTSGKFVGWTNNYTNARVVTLLLGHDDAAWNNPAFPLLLQQSIRWAAESGK